MTDEVKYVESMDDIQTLGRYSAYICLLAEIMFLSQLGNVNYMVYAGLAPHATFCERSNSTEANSNKLSCDVLNSTLQNSLCANSFHPQFYSANIEFGYLCDETKYIKRSISYQMIGLIFGSILFGQLSDSYGRKWPMIVCLIGCVVTDFISSFATGLLTLTIYRAAALLFTGGQTAVWLVFMVENIPKKDRLWINMVVSWSPNIALFAFIAYLCGNWQTLARVTGALTVPAIILALFIYESPRWLIQKGKTEEACKIVKKMIAFNGGPKITDDVIANVIAKENAAAAISAGNENFYMYHLFCTAQLTIYTLVYSFSYTSTSIINYGVFFNMAKLPGSIYTNNIFIGLSRWVVNAAVGVFDYKVKGFGRKLLHDISLGTIIIAVVIVSSLIQLDISEQYAVISRFCILLIPIIASNVYIGNNVSSNELFPTPIRNAAFAFLQVVNRLGVAIAPQLFVLGEYWTAAPYAAMLLLAGTDLTLSHVFVPETKGRPLKDCMPSVEERFFTSKAKATNSKQTKCSNGEEKYAIESCV
uniref:Major facilitator superfamily (MFS) profile domain-containing protein n=1 Tax=Parascaris univalens TaxID=6257 RepID=A0A915AI72_PARUN